MFLRWIKAIGGFIQNKDLWIMQQRLGKPTRRLKSFRQSVDRLIHHPAKIGAGNGQVDRSVAFRAVDMSGGGRNLEMIGVISG